MEREQEPGREGQYLIDKRNGDAVSDVEALELGSFRLDDRQMEMERDDDEENWPDGKGNWTCKSSTDS